MYHRPLELNFFLECQNTVEIDHGNYQTVFICHYMEQSLICDHVFQSSCLFIHILKVLFYLSLKQRFFIKPLGPPKKSPISRKKAIFSPVFTALCKTVAFVLPVDAHWGSEKGMRKLQWGGASRRQGVITNLLESPL